jgi:hypothetical protein
MVAFLSFLRRMQTNSPFYTLEKTLVGWGGLELEGRVKGSFFFENGRFEIFTSKDVLKLKVFQPDVLKT